MKIYTKISAVILATTLLTSCGPNGMSKQGGGTAIGAVGGALLGAQFGKGGGQLLAAGLGAVAGGFIGNRIGKSMDDTDRMMAERSSRKALEYSPSGQAVEWRNPDNNHSGYITPTRTFKNPNDGRYCREYTQVVNIGGKQEKAYGKACRQPDGQWEVVR